MTEHVWDVVVGNVGLVYSGPDGREAAKTFLTYLEMSKANQGRVAGEPITLMYDGNPLREYAGEIND